MTTKRNHEWVICPHCGYQHGDATEWCTSETPQTTACNACGKSFRCWAEYSVDYVSCEVAG